MVPEREVTMYRKHVLVSTLLAVSTVGCGGKSKEESFADTYCAEVLKCCTQAGLSGGQGSLCRMGMAGGVTNIDACLTEMHAEVADGSFCTYLGNPPTATAASAACAAPVRHGNKKPGEDCIVDSDCAVSTLGPVVCAGAYVDGDFINKCQVQIPGKAGDSPCLATREGNMTSSAGQTTDVAPQGIVCDSADGVVCQRETCVALTTVGGTCGASSECVRTAFCESSQGKCTTRLAIGRSCPGRDDDECEGGYCADQGGERTCAPRLLNGAVCTQDSMCTSDNCIEGSCKPSLFDAFGLGFLCG